MGAHKHRHALSIWRYHKHNETKSHKNKPRANQLSIFILQRINANSQDILKPNCLSANITSLFISLSSTTPSQFVSTAFNTRLAFNWLSRPPVARMASRSSDALILPTLSLSNLFNHFLNSSIDTSTLPSLVTTRGLTLIALFNLFSIYILCNHFAVISYGEKHCACPQFIVVLGH